MAPEPEESKYTDSQIVNSSTLYVQNVPVSYDFRFKCILTNTRSILNKVNEFKIFVNLHLPDFVAVTETWLDNEVPIALYLLIQMSIGVFARTGGLVVVVYVYSLEKV